jgi:RNA polymerase sigma factor (sigma-70 family)
MTRDQYGQAYQRGFEGTVRFLLSRGCSSRDWAREIAQGAWVRGWERLYQLRDESTVVTWVNTIALNAHRAFRRREAVFEELRDFKTDVDLNVAAIDMAQLLKVCRPRDRFLFEQQMRGTTTEEIARNQGVTETAIRNRLLRARRAIRTRIERRAPSAARVEREREYEYDVA